MIQTTRHKILAAIFLISIGIISFYLHNLLFFCLYFAYSIHSKVLSRVSVTLLKYLSYCQSVVINTMLIYSKKSLFWNLKQNRDFFGIKLI